jgi:hypothetical protein
VAYQGTARHPLDHNDVLVLYTNGVTDALSDSEASFGQERLIATVRASFGCSFEEIQNALLGDVQVFAGDAPETDDIALMILARGPPPGGLVGERADRCIALGGDPYLTQAGLPSG